MNKNREIERHTKNVWRFYFAVISVLIEFLGFLNK